MPLPDLPPGGSQHVSVPLPPAPPGGAWHMTAFHQWDEPSTPPDAPPPAQQHREAHAALAEAQQALTAETRRLLRWSYGLAAVTVLNLIMTLLTLLLRFGM